ncbi:response regulator [Massilia sp. BSC265]|uniref:response regulator n=1 Tax=Massilia sp. BSC265 TaxID=1549812 RepID=UPI00068E5205|nr:response regulator [Massilia sp. BSC265]
MNRPILLVSGAPAPAHLFQLRERLLAAGFHLESTASAQAVELVREKAGLGQAPDVILVDAAVGRVGMLARMLRGVYPAGHLMFLCSNEQVPALRLELQRTPMIGSYWSIAAVDDPALERLIAEAAHGTQRRLKLRTTLDKANTLLQAPRPADGLEYRRLLMSQRYLESFLSQSSDAVVALDHRATVLYANASAASLFAIHAADMPGLQASALPCWTPAFGEYLDRIARGERFHTAECDCDIGERRLPIEVVFSRVADETGGFLGTTLVIRDISARRIAQDQLIAHQTRLEELVNERTEALRTAEVALRQSQKLEAIGKLTGGVAHDFNNILQVIGSNLEMLQAEARDNPVTLARLQKAIASVDRGAKLSSQLLSFARRQPLQPVPTNLGRIVRDMDDLLRRVLGESIEVETIVGGGLWTAMVDRNQLENVILNLAINARDAMQSEGRLTIELGNAMLDDAYVEALTDVPAGQYVMLAVSDTGSGMSPETMERAFEPFFTTKPEGEGTGLGLSMVYGFVKQSGGHIRIYSELGHGTTFKIYLPRVHASEALIEDVRRIPASGGSETILVVEDDLALQGTVVEMLSGLGYKTLKANDGESALTILKSGIHIDLLFTDVVMPGNVKSPELARQAKEIQPGIDVLFTSGYTQNAIVHGGRLDPGVELISKPYRRDDLARKIGHLLANKRQALNLLTALDKREVRSEEASAALPRRILVVEDNPDALDMLCELLKMLGQDPQGAGDGEEAIGLLAEQEFDVLLTDIGLPGMSGIDLAVQAKHRQPALKIVFASGYGAVDDLDFETVSLPKPYDLADLQRVLGLGDKLA